MYEYNAKVTNIIDGDTFDLDIDLGFYIHIHERVRILNLDTPERRGTKEKELGLIVTEYAKRHFLNEDVVIRSKENLTLKTDSFGRWLVEVILEDGRSIRDIYTELGANKYVSASYSPEKVLLMKNL